MDHRFPSLQKIRHKLFKPTQYVVFLLQHPGLTTTRGRHDLSEMEIIQSMAVVVVVSFGPSVLKPIFSFFWLSGHRWIPTVSVASSLYPQPDALWWNSTLRSVFSGKHVSSWCAALPSCEALFPVNRTWKQPSTAGSNSSSTINSLGYSSSLGLHMICVKWLKCCVCIIALQRKPALRTGVGSEKV